MAKKHRVDCQNHRGIFSRTAGQPDDVTLFVKIQQVMIETLLPYPEARQALSRGLDALVAEIEQDDVRQIND